MTNLLEAFEAWTKALDEGYGIDDKRILAGSKALDEGYGIDDKRVLAWSKALDECYGIDKCIATIERPLT